MLLGYFQKEPEQKVESRVNSRSSTDLLCESDEENPDQAPCRQALEIRLLNVCRQWRMH